MKLSKKVLAPIFTALAAASLVGACGYDRYSDVDVKCVDKSGQETEHKTFHNAGLIFGTVELDVIAADNNQYTFPNASCTFEFSK
jgi:hypothetical protein